MCESGIKEIYKAKANESMAIQTENLAVLWRLGYNKGYVIQEAHQEYFVTSPETCGEPVKGHKDKPTKDGYREARLASCPCS